MGVKIRPFSLTLHVGFQCSTVQHYLPIKKNNHAIEYKDIHKAMHTLEDKEISQAFTQRYNIRRVLSEHCTKRFS